MPVAFPDNTTPQPWDDDIRASWNEEHDLTTSQHKFPGTPDGTKFLADDRNWRRPVQTAQIKIFDDTTLLTTGDGKFIFACPPSINGYNLIDADAWCSTPSSSGLVIVQIRNISAGFDMLTTRITIDSGEYDSYTAATPPVIDTAHDDVLTGHRLAIDVDGAGTGVTGFGVTLSFQ